MFKTDLKRFKPFFCLCSHYDPQAIHQADCENVQRRAVYPVRLYLWVPSGLTLPQSLWLSVVAEGILAFFLLALSFSPAFTTSLVSFLQVGQYLAEREEMVSADVNRGVCCVTLRSAAVKVSGHTGQT